MKSPRSFQALAAAVCLAAGITPGNAGITIDMVNIGNAGNAADTTGYGAVSYDHAIGKYEVTIRQYTAFLNAVAATDTYGLYHSNMGTNLNVAGITRSGSPGSYSYSVMNNSGNSANRPITYVSWFDAARFSNWMQNGQGSGSTETGAYTLNGATSGVGFTKNAGATFWLPSENEWYKAAYNQPKTMGGPADNYWLYPTQSDSAPGNLIGSGANQVNQVRGLVYSVTRSGSYFTNQNYLTDGGAFSGSASFYGTFDQGGNVWEWNDSVISGSNRGLRGGAWNNGYGEGGLYILESTFRHSYVPTNEAVDVGFRVASVVGAGQPRAAAVWNVTSDFSIQNGNPNDAWTYGMVVNSQFQSYALNIDDENNRIWWQVGGTPQIGFKYGNPSNGTQTGQVYLHPGPSGQASIAQWTAPAGIISPVQVQGRFFPGDSGVMQVGIFVNSIPQVATPYWHSTDSGTFNFALPVAAGDTVRFAVYGGYVASSTPLQATITAYNAGFNPWKVVEFGNNADNPLIAGALADPDHDGNSNLLEYATGTSPTTANGNPFVGPMLVAGPARQLIFPFRPAAPDLRYIVKRSPDLINWTEIYNYDISTGIFTRTGVTTVENYDTRIITLTDPAPGSQLFWKLVVEQP